MYKVRFVNYPRQYQRMKKEFDGVFEEVMSGGDFILRRHLEGFEKTIASYVGTKHAIGVNTGTDAVYLSKRLGSAGDGGMVCTKIPALVQIPNTRSSMLWELVRARVS